MFRKENWHHLAIGKMSSGQNVVAALKNKVQIKNFKWYLEVH
jgi:hypothetical protein